jgi:proline iminopeptidase
MMLFKKYLIIIQINLYIIYIIRIINMNIDIPFFKKTIKNNKSLKSKFLKNIKSKTYISNTKNKLNSTKKNKPAKSNLTLLLKKKDKNIISTYKDEIILSKTKLYKSSKPIKQYKLKVSTLHTIVYYTYGNKYGKPVLCVHGGPGAGSSNNTVRFFNPAKYYIILVDQRGCGKSTPFAELRENTTWDLIEDFEKVRKELSIDEWMVFGGSWGSTLSLVYAINYPDRVTELVLRGIFLATKKEIDWVTENGGLETFNPSGWNIYSKTIPEKYRLNKYIDTYGKCFNGDFGEKLKDDCLLSWSIWESMNSNLKQESVKNVIKNLKKGKSYIALSKIEHHYFSNLCFLSKNYLTDKSTLDKIKNIPLFIVQGMYDLVCPYENAYRLHRLLPKSILYQTIAGHSQFEPENIKYLVKITDSLS